MAEGVAVSIVICTRDRAASLAATLAALGAIAIPADLPAELLVVDNGSRDATATVVRDAVLPALAVRCIHEGRAGVAHARNAGLRAARGEIVVYLDDDARPAADWLPRLCAPIRSGAADAAAGSVHLPDAVVQPWMEPLHRAWLASTEYLDPAAPAEFVTANAALHRRVLDRVPAFDPELGPGALGQGEDALFAWQLRRAGYRLAAASDAVVAHHVEPSRTTPSWFRATALRRGRAMAYQQHHWEHAVVPHARRRLAIAAARALRHRIGNGGAAPPALLLALERLSFLRHWLVESRRPRHYQRHGLVKLAGVLP